MSTNSLGFRTELTIKPDTRSQTPDANPDTTSESTLVGPMMRWYRVRLCVLPMLALLLFLSGGFGMGWVIHYMTTNDSSNSATTSYDYSGYGTCDSRGISIDTSFLWTQYPAAPEIVPVTDDVYNEILGDFVGKNAIVWGTNLSSNIFRSTSVTNTRIDADLTFLHDQKEPCHFTLDKTDKKIPAIVLAYAKFMCDSCSTPPSKFCNCFCVKNPDKSSCKKHYSFIKW